MQICGEDAGPVLLVLCTKLRCGPSPGYQHQHEGVEAGFQREAASEMVSAATSSGLLAKHRRLAYVTQVCFLAILDPGSLRLRSGRVKFLLKTLPGLHMATFFVCAHVVFPWCTCGDKERKKKRRGQKAGEREARGGERKGGKLVCLAIYQIRALPYDLI
jgi:hypothetical protein